MLSRCSTGGLITYTSFYQKVIVIVRLHCEQFPNCIPLSKAHVKEVWGIVVHACAG
jgi:hypothetical protein